MKTVVSQLLAEKGHEIYSVSPESSVFEAIQIMAEKSIGALIVVGDGDSKRAVGIISERDYARKIVLEEKSSKNTKVKEIMSSPVITVSTHDIVGYCISLMTENRIRHLPVVNDGQLQGMLSIGDLVRTIIANQQDTIQQLENYITS